MAEAGDSDCEKQKNDISRISKIPLKKGDTWYLLCMKWYRQWKKYVGYDNWDTSLVGDKSAHPGPIDLSNILTEENALRESLMDEIDFQLVHESGWKLFRQWYGLLPGQVDIARKVIEQGMFVKNCKVEVYLVGLKLCENSDLDRPIAKSFSKNDTIEQIEQEMRTMFHISDNKEVRLWNRYLSNTFEQLHKKESTVQDAGLYAGQMIVIEQKNEDGSWPRQASKVTSTSFDQASNSSSSSFSNKYGSTSRNFGGSSSYDSGYQRSSTPGLCGLGNLGNTCFMNSALQCLSNVPMLTQFFNSDQWKQDLNYDNPLGMHGEIANTYAELIRTMWSGQYSYTAPRSFKVALGRFAPQFSGYQQQDSQELMAFLLDGLHEDLNRIRKKPYVEQKDSDNRPDAVVAEESWDNYKRRNNSAIVDTFHGLLKSTLVCPECAKVSVTFDPFCYLSLPLPVIRERQLELFVVFLNPSQRTRQFKVTVPKMGYVSDLCSALARLSGLDPNKMVVADVYNHRFHKIFTNDESLTHILDRDDIFVYESPVSSLDDPDTLVLPLYMRERRVRETYNNYRHVTSQLFGQPLMLAVPRADVTYDALYKLVLKRLSRSVRQPEPGEVWWKVKDEPEEDGDEADAASGPSSESQGVEAAEGEAAQPSGTGAKRTPRLFTFQIVNSYGSAEVDKIRDDGRPLKLSPRTYLSMDWSVRARELFLNDRNAEAVELDASMRVSPKSRVVQLEDSLDLFVKQERLGENDPWYCPQCKKHQRATKKFDLWDLPTVLVIHLKRFSYNRYWRDKLDTLVEYPTRRLNMSSYVINKQHSAPEYDLIGVVNHFGGMGGGHYTAFCKHVSDGEWYNFDDSSVTGTSEESVVTRSGYVLVYQRRDSMNMIMRSPSARGSGSQRQPNGLDSDDDMDVN